MQSMWPMLSKLSLLSSVTAVVGQQAGAEQGEQYKSYIKQDADLSGQKGEGYRRYMKQYAGEYAELVEEERTAQPYESYIKQLAAPGGQKGEGYQQYMKEYSKQYAELAADTPKPVVQPAAHSEEHQEHHGHQYSSYIKQYAGLNDQRGVGYKEFMKEYSKEYTALAADTKPVELAAQSKDWNGQQHESDIKRLAGLGHQKSEDYKKYTKEYVSSQDASYQKYMKEYAQEPKAEEPKAEEPKAEKPKAEDTKVEPEPKQATVVPELGESTGDSSGSPAAVVALLEKAPTKEMLSLLPALLLLGLAASLAAPQMLRAAWASRRAEGGAFTEHLLPSEV